MKMWIEYFRLAIKTFLHQKKRTGLTLIGIFIGIAAVVSLISLGQGLKDGVNEQFEVLGTNKIFIQPSGPSMFGISSTKLHTDDVEIIKSISGVDIVGGAVYKMGQIEFHGERHYTWVMGIDSSNAKNVIAESFGYKLEKGRFLDDNKDLWVNYRHWSGDFFDVPVRIGDKIKIEGERFTIVGEVAKIGNPEDDAQVSMPLEAAQDLLNIDRTELNFIVVSVNKNEEPSEIAKRIERKLRKAHNVKEGEEDFKVSTTEDFKKSFDTVLTIVQIILIGIAAISLLVGGVNITNTIYTSVLERTNEIGIMKAIGARNSDVFYIFLVESGILGLVGGIVGIILGIGMSKTVAIIADLSGWAFIRASFSSYLIIGALLFSFIVGAAAGAVPAWQASKMKPVDALRYE